MKKTFFITGTDTNIGKTYCSIQLLKVFHLLGLSTLGIKPIASGCLNNESLNQDALELQKHSSIKLPYRHINPFAFKQAIAPHIAASFVKCELNLAILNQKLQFALEFPSDICLIEGAGGWRLPLNSHETLADFVVKKHFAIILIVGIRLGCINHSILTYEAMQNDKANIVGWIANCLDSNMSHIEENIATLQHWLAIPHLATIGYQQELTDITTLRKIIF